MPVSYGFNELSNATAWDPSWNYDSSGDAATTEDSETDGEGTEGDEDGNDEANREEEQSPENTSPSNGGGNNGDNGGGGNEPNLPQPPTVDDVIGDLEDLFN